MFIKVAMSKGRKGRRLTTCRPTDPRSVSLLSDFYPDANWLAGQPFDTGEFVLFVSDAPLGNEVAVKLLPIPYAEPAGAYTRFEIHDDKGNRIGTSMEHPVTQLLLLTSELDPEIIAGQMPIYLGVSPATPRVIVDGPEELGIDVGPPTTVVCPPEETDIVVSPPNENVSGEGNPKNGSQGEPVAGIKRIEHDLTDKELASKYLGFFLHHHISYSKGSRLTSAMLHAAIEAHAPIDVPIDLLSRREIVAAVRGTFGIVMDRIGERNGGKNQQFWQNYEVRICYPDPLERQWYDTKSR